MPDEPSEPSGLPPKKPRFRIRGGDRNKTLDALSALSRASPTPGHRSDFIQEINQEKNDRGAAILAVTNVENILETCIVRSIIDDGRFYDKLFGFNAPISTFDNKIRIAYALEIISTQMYENLNVIRALRNAFAHSKIPITFRNEGSRRGVYKRLEHIGNNSYEIHHHMQHNCCQFGPLCLFCSGMPYN
jgi:hypothetical protein